jgi:hypothetical protein
LGIKVCIACFEDVNDGSAFDLEIGSPYTVDIIGTK